MRLHINIDHVATIRQARRTDEPDPVRAAVLAELGGADGITVHLRQDRRHVSDRDVRLLMETVRTGVNLELGAVPDMVDIACALAPMTTTLVPERREEITTEGGLALGKSAPAGLRGAIDRLRAANVRTSLFIDADRSTVDSAFELGVEAVELHTGPFAEAWKVRHRTDGAKELSEQIARLRRAAAHGAALGLAVHAGHGLTYENVARVAAISDIEELNIGHSVISRAVLVGMEAAVREMKSLLRVASPRVDAA